MENNARWRVILAVLLGMALAGCGGTGGPLDDDDDDDGGGGGTIWDVTVRETSPIVNAEVSWVYTIDRTPLLDWTDVPEAAVYELQISPNNSDVNSPDVTGATPIIECSGSSYQVTVPYEWGTDQFWRIRAIKADGTASKWIMPFHFQVAQAAVIAPFPADGGTTDDPSPVLDWNDLSGAESYDLVLSSTMSPTGGVLFQKTGLLESRYELTGTPPELLPVGTTLYWFVRAKNDYTGGTDYDKYSEWSTSFDLTLNSAEIPVGNLRDNVNTLDRTPLLSWNTITGATGYEIYLSSDPSTVWSATPSFQAGESSTTCTLSPMSFGTHVAWGIKARVGPDPASYPTSAVMEFSVASAYHPLGGPNGVSGDNPNLWWTPMIGAASYDVEVALDASLHSVVASSTVTEPKYVGYKPVPSVGYGNSRYWRIRARSDEGDTTSWSPAFCYTVSWSQLDIHAVAPADDATIFDQTPLLNWSDTDFVDKWEVWVTDVLPFESKFSGKYTTADDVSELQHTLVLAMGKTWYWRVRPLNPEGVVGLWSPPFSFSTSASFSPTPSSPDPSTNQTPTVTWSSVTGAVSYWMQSAKSEAELAAAPMVEKGTATSHTFTTIPVGSPRYWRVLARNDNNTASPWSVTSSVSVTWTYTIDALSPAHKATNVSKATGLVIDWSAVTGASSYEILSSTVQPFDSGGIKPCATHAYTTTTPLLANKKYYWRARPINSEGIAGSWSDTFDFTTGP